MLNMKVWGSLCSGVYITLNEAFNNVESIVANKTKYISAEKRALQIKHEKSCAVNKDFRSELECFMKNLNSANLALKTSKKGKQRSL
jgi:ribosomal protein S20